MNINEKKDAQITATLHALSHDGRGIATINNKTTFIDGALPTETITYRITQKRSTYQEAQALEILTPASERVTPPCPHFSLCGGCSLQHMSMALQLQLKQQTLIDQLKHFGQVTPEAILEPLSALTTGYRRKARLGVKFVIKKNKLLVGFREKSSRYLADLTQCKVLLPAVGEHLHDLSELIASLEAYQHIPQIEVAAGDTEIALVFRHMIPLTDADKSKLAHFAREHGFHLYLQPNPPEPISKLWPEDDIQRIHYTLPDQGLSFRFHPLDFTQINLEVNRQMVNQALRLLDVQPHDKVLDLFCGIGNFTLPLAQRAAQVTGIEGSDDMVQRALENARHNQLSNTAYAAANLMDPDPHAPWMSEKYDKILLDPPRAGAKEIIAHFHRFDAKKIVYVSCNPATLARDAGELVQQGYKLTLAGIMNMFPHTAHIEAMAVFERE